MTQQTLPAVRVSSMEPPNGESRSTKAVAAILIGEQFAVRGVRVVEGKQGGLFVSMPSRKLKDGTYQDIFWPVTKESQKHLRDAVMEVYNGRIAKKEEVFQ